MMLRFLSSPRFIAPLLPVSAALFLGGCGAKEAPLELRSDAVVRTNLVQSVSVNGTINPLRLVSVGSQVGGLILELNADFNSRVKEGEVIAKIDPSTYDRALTQAKARLASSQADLVQAEFDAKQTEALYNLKQMPESDLVRTKATLLKSRAAVQTQEAAVESADVDLKRTTIYAPINGMVISRAVEAGQTVAASFNTPTLFTIASDLTKMQIELAVSEADIGTVEYGQRVDFTVDAFTVQMFSGQVRQVRFAPTTNQSVVTYTTVVDIDNPDMRLRPGMTANAFIITSEKTNILRVASSALRFTPPAGLKVLPATNKVSTNDVVRSPGGMNGDQGFPTPPWVAQGRFRPADDEREKWLATLTPEQKEAYDKFRAEMRKRMAEGGGGGPGGPGGNGGPGGGGAPRPRPPSGPTLRTVYLAGTNTSAGKPELFVQAVNIKVGTSDNLGYEVLEGLNAGTAVVTGTRGGPSATPTPTANPLGSPFGGAPRR